MHVGRTTDLKIAPSEYGLQCKRNMVYGPLVTTRLWAVFPLRNFYTEQMFVSVRMQLRNHVNTQLVKRFKR